MSCSAIACGCSSRFAASDPSRLDHRQHSEPAAAGPGRRAVWRARRRRCERRRRAGPGGAASLAGRERLSSDDGGRAARRVLAARRHPRYLRPRLVRPGADRVVRRRDRIDPPLRGRQPAQPGDARRAWTITVLGPQADREATLPTICRRRAGSCWSSRRSWRKKAGAICNRVERPQDYFGVDATLTADLSLPFGHGRGASPAARWRRPAT